MSRTPHVNPNSVVTAKGKDTISTIESTPASDTAQDASKAKAAPVSESDTSNEQEPPDKDTVQGASSENTPTVPTSTTSVVKKSVTFAKLDYVTKGKFVFSELSGDDCVELTRLWKRFEDLTGSPEVKFYMFQYRFKLMDDFH